jgi:hypothetical protein
MRTISLAAAALAVLVGSCNESSSGGRFFIVQNQVPDARCVINTGRTIYRGEGGLDVQLVGTSGFAYTLFPLIQNDYPSSGGAGAPEANRLFVRAFRVRVEAGAGAAAKVSELIDRLGSADATRALVEFQEPWAATIDPGGGLLAAGVGVIPGELARQIRNLRVLDNGQTTQLNVRVRAVGQRRDGEVESEEFVYPIRVCEGCLIASVKTCPSTPVNFGNPCNPAQDSAVDCCLDGAELHCPATPPATK